MTYTVDARSLLPNHLIGEGSTTRPSRLVPSHALGALRPGKDRDANQGNALLQALSLAQNRGQRDGVQVEVSLRSSSEQRDAHSLSSALRTTNRGLSMVDTAREGYSSIREKLEEMLSVAQEAKDAPAVGADRVRLAERFDELKIEIDQISVSTEYGGRPLLDGRLVRSPIFLNLGTKGSADDELRIDFGAVSSESLGVTVLDVNAQDMAADTEVALQGIVAAFAQDHQGRADIKFDTLTQIAEKHTASREQASARSRDLGNVRQEALSAREFSSREATAALVVQASIEPAMAQRLLG